MPLSEHEQRILAELEDSLVRQDPEFAERVRSETVYRHAGRYCKWAAVGFVAGVAILVAFYSQSVVGGPARRGGHVRLGRGLRAQPAPHGQGRLARPDPLRCTTRQPSGAGGGIEHAVHGARDWFRSHFFRRDT